MKKLIIVSFILFTSCKLFSEINFNLINGYTQSQIEDYNSFQTPITITGLNLNQNLAPKLALFSNFGFAQYYNYTDRNYISGLAGLGYSTYINEKNTASISSYISSNLRKSVSTDDYSDSYQINTGIQFVNSLKIGNSIYLKSDFKYKDFTRIPELNYIDNSTKMIFINSFETKTSIKLIASLNTKIYKSLLNLDNTNHSSSAKFNDFASQFEYQVSIAQNIFEKTGLSFIYKSNYALNNYETSLDYIGFDFAGDSEFFDDPFSFTFNQYDIKLTQILPIDFSFSAKYSSAVKNYNYEFMMEDESFLERKDSQSAFEISISKDIKIENTFLQKIKIKVDYEMYKNSSNINFLSFNGNYILVAFELKF